MALAIFLLALAIAAVLTFVYFTVSAVIKLVSSVVHNRRTSINWKRWVIIQLVLVLVAIASIITLFIHGGFLIVGLFI